MSDGKKPNQEAEVPDLSHISPALRPLARPIEGLQPDPANVRRHSEKNLSAIRGSLRRFGQQKAIVVDGDGVVVAGNGTLDAAVAEGWSFIAVTVTELTGPEAIAFAIADNRSSELGEWERDELGAVLGALDDELKAATGFTEQEIENLVTSLVPPATTAPEPEGEKDKIKCPQCGHEFTT